MTGRLLTLDLLATLLVAALWIATAAAVLAGRARLALPVLGAAALATAGRVVVVGLLGSSGWWFVQEKVLLTLPLVVLPGAAAVALAGPALLRGSAPGAGRHRRPARRGGRRDRRGARHRRRRLPGDRVRRDPAAAAGAWAPR